MISLPGYTYLSVVYEDDRIRVVHAYSQSALRVVAIKMAKEGPWLESENAKLVHEFHLLSGLQQDNVLKPHALERQGEAQLLVHYIIQCITLRHYIASSDRTPGRSLGIAGALCRVVAELHRNGIVHMNIRPDTILVQPETAQVYITGFSEAVRLPVGEAEGVVPKTIPEGHPLYNAPEHTRNMEAGLFDPRSDLYALGATLYELFGGGLPVEVGGIERLPIEVAPVIRRLLAERAADRYDDAAQAASDLERSVHDGEGPQLTAREREVLELMASGHSGKEIAAQLQVTFETVKAHTKNIYAKLNVNRRVQAVIEAKKQRLL